MLPVVFCNKENWGPQTAVMAIWGLFCFLIICYVDDIYMLYIMEKNNPFPYGYIVIL